ncbi:MAG: hypothetical protein AMXMBFR55_03060 [Gemmatimonadota bacterium]
MSRRSAPARHAAFAVSAPGLAPLAARELVGLGFTVGGVESAGVAFETDARGLCLANVHLRTASRVLVRVDEFRAATFHELEKRTARIDWASWIAPGRGVSLRVTCRKSRLYHSGAVAERVAGVLAPLAGRVVHGTGGAEGEDADEGGEAQLVVVRLLNDRCTISLDSSGALLHQRGYRLATGRAPLRETLGAALLLASGWAPGTPLVDPFCGAGTLAIEGAMLARRIAPGVGRPFALERWPGVAPATVSRIREEARSRELADAGAPLLASDRDAGAVEAARSNAERAGVLGDISFAVRAVSHLAPPDGSAAPGAIVTNPPYGVRVGEGELRNLYARTGAVLRERFPGWRLAIVSADRRLTGQLGIPLADAVRTSNGGIPVTFAVGDVPGEG